MDDFREFVDGYYDQFVEVLRRFDRGALTGILEVLHEIADREATLWVAGNGGSAAISDHAACDVTKGTHAESQPPIRSVSLSSNGAMLTALANDVAYDQVFSKQLEFYLRDGDAVLLVSASGNSPNVVEACRYAKARGVPTIAFVGFSGGKLKELADHVVHVDVENYGMAEDAHQSVMHVLSQFIAAKRNSAGQR